MVQVVWTKAQVSIMIGQLNELEFFPTTDEPEIAEPISWKRLWSNKFRICMATHALDLLGILDGQDYGQLGNSC
ncbi:MAG: hypothetical protein CMJ81_17535 [Planctomycetaceae bacterium]|nr:hypothetical protein [Planctomycetaceae bacterium]MBP62838.1 hypothetical protein [Planctomycetaceae bacterium]